MPKTQYSDVRGFIQEWQQLPIFGKLAILFIAISPLFHLAINNWTGIVVVTGVFFSIIHLIVSKNSSQVFKNTDVRRFIFVFLAYIAAVFISQAFRQNWIFYPYHDVAPFLYGIPILLVLVQLRISLENVLRWVLPLSILATYFSSHFIFESGNDGGRKGIYFVDLLVFGYTNVTIGMMCLANVLVDVFRKKIQIATYLNILAILASTLLAIETGSRTGWLAVPLCFIILVSILFKRNVLLSLFLSTLLGATLIYLAYHYVPMVHDRVSLALKEIIEYPWSGGIAPDTSVGLRITFQRIGFFHFSNSPIFGWGERGFAAFKDHPYLQTFASQYARDFCFSALFHNEFMTQSVRYGLLGLAGTFIVFFIPITFFFKAFRTDEKFQRLGALGIAYMLTLLISSLSDEVFNLKGTVTYSTLIIATLAGSILAKVPLNDSNQK